MTWQEFEARDDRFWDDQSLADQIRRDESLPPIRWNAQLRVIAGALFVGLGAWVCCNLGMWL